MDDLIIETNEQENLEPDDGWEDNLTANISNLSMALSSLSEIDSGLMNKSRQAKLNRMKKHIFNTLYYYCDCLPQIQEDDDD